MQRSKSAIRPTRRWSLWLLPMLLLAASGAYAGPPLVYTVGPSSGCNYSNLRDALAAAAITNAPTIEIHMALAIDNSLGYGYGGNNSAVSVTNQHPAKIVIAGAYATCTAAQPSPMNASKRG